MSCTHRISRAHGTVHVMESLNELGWDDGWASLFSPHAAAGLLPGRVTVSHRGAHDVATADGELRCEVRGRLYDEASSPADLPVVGDWVALTPPGDGKRGVIEALLPRRTRFSRKVAWQAAEEQVLAANVDLVLVATAVDQDFNPRRLERYLVLARESGARVVVLLTKTDLHPDPATLMAETLALAGDVPVLPISNRSGVGLEAVRALLAPGTTAAILGSSGVGKSTLVNTLADEEILATSKTRADGKGRHTTTRRELVRLPWGALLIDTPGIRELQLWVVDEGLDETFPDVVDLFGGCRFNDCMHGAEPGCAVKQAVADGSLAQDRWDSYLALEAELAHLGRRLDTRVANEERRLWRQRDAEGRAAARTKGRKDV